MTEIWKDIIEFDGYYQVSNLGNVKSLERWISHPKGGLRKMKGKHRKTPKDSDGYNIVILNKFNKSTVCRVHRLVAIHFIPNPNNLPQINHKNGIKTDNQVENLEWSDNRENNTHRLIGKKRQSKFVGVTRNPRCSTWRAIINVDNKSIYLGSYRTEKEAGEKYIKALSDLGLSNKYAV